MHIKDLATQDYIAAVVETTSLSTMFYFIPVRIKVLTKVWALCTYSNLATFSYFTHCKLLPANKFTCNGFQQNGGHSSNPLCSFNLYTNVYYI